MAKLIFLLDGNVLKEYALDKERMTIGRRPSNDIYIDNLAISGTHAVLVTMGENTYLEDLGSTNGTLVNNKKVTKQALTHGDEIGLGKYQLKYLKDGVAKVNESNGFADTVLVPPAAQESQVSDVAPEDKADEPAVDEAKPEAMAPAAEVAEVNDEEAPSAEEASASETDEVAADNNPGQKARLQVLNGENEGSTLLLDKSMVKIGEQGKQVAVVTKRQGGYFVTHVAGDQHPTVNGTEIGVKAYALSHHDELEVMGIRMRCFLE